MLDVDNDIDTRLIPESITKPNVLIVEGKDDKLFLGALIKHLAIESIQVLPIGGKTKFGKNLKGLKPTPGFDDVKSLGIIRDADTNPKSAFQSVCDALDDVGLPVPDKPLEPAGQEPSVTVLILPKENASGCLETLCLEAQEREPAMHCVEEYFECLRKHGVSEPSNPSTLCKAKVHVFLASKKKAGLRLGESARSKYGYWPWDHNAFDQVRDFLRGIS